MSDDAQKRQPPAPIMRMTLQGAAPPLDDPDRRARAIEQAFDYRGDVTLTTADGQTLEGYVFDRRNDQPDPILRMMLPDGSRRTVRYDEVTHLEFTGRDAAEGRSWDTWVKKYVEKKQAGQSASIEPEKLE